MNTIKTGKGSTTKGFLDRFFNLSNNGTNVRTEFFAGVTMFIASVYILAVIPNLLVASGMPRESTVAAVILTTAFATMLIGFVANIPVVIAPGLGLSAFFSYTICGSMGLSWQTALGAVFISGAVFVILTVTRILNRIIDSIPQVLKTSIGVGIGLFIAFIGFKNAHIIVADKATFVGLGNMQDPAVLLTLFGLIITSVLLAKQVKGGLLIGMVITTVLAMALGITKVPQSLSDIFNLVPPIPVDTFGQFDIKSAFAYGIVSIIFSITIVDMFDNIGTLIGVTRKANLVGPDGKFKGLNKALLCTSIAAAGGAIIGTSTVTSYIESAAGVADGGRTGLTAVVTGLLYVVSLFFAPLFLLVPAQATAPVLIIVGVFMISEVIHIDFSDFTEALPAFLTILLMPLTFSIAQGISFGFVSYTLIKMATGRFKDIHPIMYALTIAFIIHFAM
ncbi:MAG: NCS2 family permease [Veillonella caviae]|uniref:NCS2 family permease n=1 Tax=Veillonella caviae TaxID=248316 RepID=UPI0023F6E158|nr:NCS2 family permease [Veillonella caviae]MDD7291654.1 NCS2 family permease [Veillonella caviae]